MNTHSTFMLVLALVCILSLTMPTSAGLIYKKARPHDAEHMVAAMDKMNHAQKIAIARSVLGIDEPPVEDRLVISGKIIDDDLNVTRPGINCYRNCWKTGGCSWNQVCVQLTCCL